jgi:hypothetical protein
MASQLNKKRMPSLKDGIRFLFLPLEACGLQLYKLVLITDKLEGAQLRLVNDLRYLFSIDHQLMLRNIEDFVGHAKIVDGFKAKQ